MDDFKSYYKNQNTAKSDGTSNAANGSKQGTDGAKQTIDLAAQLAQAFAGKSEGQIFNTIVAQAEQGKRDGTLTNADIDNFYNTVAPLLDGFKRKKLAQIVARLKEI